MLPVARQGSLNQNLLSIEKRKEKLSYLSFDLPSAGGEIGLCVCKLSFFELPVTIL